MWPLRADARSLSGATQTPPGLSNQKKEGYSRVDFYLEQVLDCLKRLEEVTYWVGDGYYAKTKFFDALTLRGKHLITKLRSDWAHGSGTTLHNCTEYCVTKARDTAGESFFLKQCPSWA